MNPDLGRLKPYPFERLAGLLRGVEPAAGRDPISLSIGEPRHPTPALVSEALIAHLHTLSVYPSTRGMPALRQAIATWLYPSIRPAPGCDRPRAPDTPGQWHPRGPVRLRPGGHRPHPRRTGADAQPLLSDLRGGGPARGGEPHYLPCLAEHGFVPDFEAVTPDTWRRCQVLYLCSPGNPTGAVVEEHQLTRLIELAHTHDFLIAADECYSELYRDEDRPPCGLLQAAAAMGNTGFERCLVFHSLSKRSNAPGLRSGFVAGDAAVIERLFAYRTYHGCAMPPATQHASIAAWSDEVHVRANRALYREKFAAVTAILGDVLPAEIPAGGFYLWPETPDPGDRACAPCCSPRSM